MNAPRFTTLALRQRALDTQATRLFPALASHKRQKLMTSPHAFLRGAAPLFYELLAARRDLLPGAPGEGWLVGDMHLENVGAYRSGEDRVAFDINDFDDAMQGPWEVDVLRLSTSVLLAGRTFTATGPEALALVRALLASYREALAGKGADRKKPQQPRVIRELVERAEKRQREDLLDSRAPKQFGKRHFIRQGRYLPLPVEVAEKVPALLAAYQQALGKQAPPDAPDWQIEDAAQRVAGNGSLGRLRAALIVEGKKEGKERMLELKEAGQPSGQVLLGEGCNGGLDPATRVVTGAHALLEHPHRFLAAVPRSPVGLPLVGRQLWPQEDKLDLSSLEPGPELTRVVECIGETLARAHLRAARQKPKASWTDAQAQALVESAIELAGLHEGVYLAYCHLPDDTAPARDWTQEEEG